MIAMSTRSIDLFDDVQYSGGLPSQAHPFQVRARPHSEALAGPETPVQRRKLPELPRTFSPNWRWKVSSSSGLDTWRG